MTGSDDRIVRADRLESGDDAWADLPAGSLELEQGVEPESAARLAELIDRMSDGRQSTAALDRMAALMAQLLVPDRLVDELVREGAGV